MTSKQDLLQLFAEKIKEMQSLLTNAALEAHAAATHAESKAEDKYDTRGLEASYLAGAQSRRAMELEQTLNTYRHVDVKNFAPGDAIASTALIELAAEDGARSFYLLMPNGGGMSAVWEGRKVQTITPQSPLGEALLGKRAGDEVSLLLGGTERDFSIIGVS